MTLFELVKIVLDELYKEGQEEYGAGLDDEIKQKLHYLSGSYSVLNDASREPVNYRDPATRFAYVFRYVASHGGYMVQILNELAAQLGGAIFQTENIRVSCVGGGPGSDIVAILKYLEENEHEPVNKIVLYLLDKELAWADTWSEFATMLNVGISLNTNFQQLDITDPGSWKLQKKYLQADLFTMSYFVSEVFSLHKSGTKIAFWKSLFEEAKPGSLFLYDDNGHTYFTNYFDAQWNTAGLECLISEDNTKFTPRYSEQASELGEYLKKFKNPKIQAKVTHRVLRKQ